MLTFKENLTGIDKPLLVIIFVLFFIGSLTCFSASAPYASVTFGDSYKFLKDQLMWGLIGIVFMLVIAMFDYRIIKKYSKHLYILSFILMLITLAMPAINGAKRWISLPGLSFQPSELVKIVLIVVMAQILEKKDWNNKIRLDTRNKLKEGLLNYLVFLIYFLPLVPFAGVAALQPHFSCLLILGAITVVIIFASGADIKYFLFSALMIVPALVAYALSADYRISRLTSFLDPFKDRLGSGYQAVQSLLAIGSGGLFGLGAGQSRQKYLYIPEPQNDFVFSILCEEMGFIGAIAVILLFMFFIIRGLKIAMNAEDKYGLLIAVGITTLIGVEALGNIAVVTATIPATGIPLPFFSAGGSSLVFLFIGLGILLSISKNCNRK